MPTAADYNANRFFDPTKKRPKVPGLATPRFSPLSIFAGRPTESGNTSDNMLEGGLAGANTQEMPTPFSSLFLFRKRTR